MYEFIIKQLEYENMIRVNTADDEPIDVFQFIDFEDPFE